MLEVKGFFFLEGWLLNIYQYTSLYMNSFNRDFNFKKTKRNICNQPFGTSTDTSEEATWNSS